MPLHKKPKCLLSQTARLDQLRADRAVEGLRGYLEQYECFGEGRDPKTSPIREEELKELVKVWKLHRQKNFWRDNTTKVRRPTATCDACLSMLTPLTSHDRTVFSRSPLCFVPPPVTL